MRRAPSWAYVDGFHTSNPEIRGGIDISFSLAVYTDPNPLVYERVVMMDQCDIYSCGLLGSKICAAGI